MEIARHWRLIDQRLRLEGSNCQGCGNVHFPTRRICPDCGHDNLKPAQSKTKEAAPQPMTGVIFPAEK